MQICEKPCKSKTRFLNFVAFVCFVPFSNKICGNNFKTFSETYVWVYAVCYEALPMGGVEKTQFLLESLFNRATGLRPATLLERDFSTGILL